MFRSAYPTKDQPAYITRYVYADTTLSTHGGNVGKVSVTSEEHTRLQQMAEYLERCCNDLDAAGYDVISITPITSGRTAYTHAETTNIHPGHGYSVTDGLVVTGRLKTQNAAPSTAPESSSYEQVETPDPPEPYLGPGLTASQYRSQAQEYLEQSARLLARSKLPDASGHGWAAAAWMFKAVAEAQGWQYRSSDEILDIARRAQQKTDDPRVWDLRVSANMLLTFSGTRNRYLQADDVSELLDRMATLLNILEPLTEPSQ